MNALTNFTICHLSVFPLPWNIHFIQLHFSPSLYWPRSIMGKKFLIDSGRRELQCSDFTLSCWLTRHHSLYLVRPWWQEMKNCVGPSCHGYRAGSLKGFRVPGVRGIVSSQQVRYRSRQSLLCSRCWRAWPIHKSKKLQHPLVGRKWKRHLVECLTL